MCLKVSELLIPNGPFYLNVFKFDIKQKEIYRSSNQLYFSSIGFAFRKKILKSIFFS